MKAAGKFALAHILVKEPKVIDMSNYSNISSCKITNDPHYQTLDGKFFYQLAHKSKDGYWMPQTPDIWVILAATTNCDGKCPSKNHPPPFSIEMQPSGEKDLSLHAGPVRVRFYLATGREQTVYSNIELRLYDAYFVVVHVGNNAGTTHTTEWSCNTECGGGSGGYTFFEITVGRSQNGWAVNTNFGVNVVTNYLSQVEIQLHNVSNYKGNLVGYCGNFNGDPNDDLACFNSTVLSYFGYCWQSKYLDHLSDGVFPGCLKCQQSLKSRPDSASQSLWSTGPSPWITSKQKELGETHCNASLKNNEAFKDCLTTTSFAENFNMCVTDVGRTGNHLSIHCLILASTARDCIVERPNASIPLHFSNNTCDPHCWTNSTWKVKMSSCPNTCEKPNAENFCRLPDSSGCECEKGLLLKVRITKGKSTIQCVPEEDCNVCLGPRAQPYEEGESWLDANCTRQTTCIEDGKKITKELGSGCGANANCTHSSDGYFCVCDAGFYGNATAGCTKLNPCNTTARIECFNGGVCKSNGNETYCVCQPGYTGVHCNSTIDACLSGPCLNGTCETVGTDYLCNCNEGFGGRECERKKLPCDGNLCQNKAPCSDSVEPWRKGSYTCECLEPYFGPLCQNASLECEEVGLYTLHDVMGHFYHECTAGYFFCDEVGSKAKLKQCKEGEALFEGKRCKPRDEVAACHNATTTSSTTSTTSTLTSTTTTPTTTVKTTTVITTKATNHPPITTTSTKSTTSTSMPITFTSRTSPDTASVPMTTTTAAVTGALGGKDSMLILGSALLAAGAAVLLVLIASCVAYLRFRD